MSESYIVEALEVFDALVVDRSHVVLEVVRVELETGCPLAEHSGHVLVHHVQPVVRVLRLVLFEADCLEPLGVLEPFGQLRIILRDLGHFDFG